ncbi:MAG: UbiX family flavin prenyltransferase [Enterobacterales bacterium]|nr:UbiX family flavin prenyltransferase [Enterobacterales bacterium]
MLPKDIITLAITGASGAAYATRLLQWLNANGYFVHVLVSDAGRVVMTTEADLKLSKSPEKQKQELVKKLRLNEDLLECWSQTNWSSPVASGSSSPDKMVVCPCTTGSLSAIATGASNNLIERAADVVLKERGKLILVPRETPYSMIHLKNMLAVTEAGGVILPASPGFYHGPEKIEQLVDFIVSRILDHLGITNSISTRWGYMNN